MSDRYDIYLDGDEVVRDDFRACPAVGSTVVLNSGLELEVVRVVYPAGDRVRLYCTKAVAKPEPKPIVEPAKPAEKTEAETPRRSRK